MPRERRKPHAVHGKRTGSSVRADDAADSRLWAAARPAVSKTGIDFAAIRPKDISTEAYVLYRAAQDIYEGTRYIGAAELVDRKLASGRMFRLICRAMELARMNQ